MKYQLVFDFTCIITLIALPWFFSCMSFFMTPKNLPTPSNIFTPWEVARPLSFCFFKSVVKFFSVSFQMVMSWKWSIWAYETSMWVNLVYTGHMGIIKFFIFKSRIANSAFKLNPVSGNSLCRWRRRFFIELINTMEIVIVRLKLCFVRKALSIRFDLSCWNLTFFGWNRLGRTISTLGSSIFVIYGDA